jgi:hypothetical protein
VDPTQGSSLRESDPATVEAASNGGEKHQPRSEPTEDFDDRMLLYAMYVSNHYNSGGIRL